MLHPNLWLAIGFVGQALFFMRFFVQWLASERAGRSVIPVWFWVFSVCGGTVLLSYAIHRQDPVFIVGQSTGLLIYFRNLHLIYNVHRASLVNCEVNGEATPSATHKKAT